MNRDSRRKLQLAAKAYCVGLKTGTDRFTQALEALKDAEENKLSNLPESLQEGKAGQNIEDAIHMMDSLLEAVDTIEESCDEILSLTDISIPAVGTSPPEYHSSASEPRDKRFQILLSGNLLTWLKLRSLQAGVSQNEIINQALTNELFKDPNIH